MKVKKGTNSYDNGISKECAHCICLLNANCYSNSNISYLIEKKCFWKRTNVLGKYMQDDIETCFDGLDKEQFNA